MAIYGRSKIRLNQLTGTWINDGAQDSGVSQNLAKTTLATTDTVTKTGSLGDMLGVMASSIKRLGGGQADFCNLDAGAFKISSNAALAFNVVDSTTANNKYLSIDTNANPPQIDIGNTNDNPNISLPGAGLVQIGATGDGADIKFWGDTAGDYMLWDADENVLEIEGTANTIAFNVTDGDASISDGTLAITNPNSLNDAIFVSQGPIQNAGGPIKATFNYAGAVCELTGGANTDNRAILHLENTEAAAAADVAMSFKAHDKSWALGYDGGGDVFGLAASANLGTNIVSITPAGAFTAAQGLTATAGGVTATAGGLTVTAGATNIGVSGTPADDITAWGTDANTKLTWDVDGNTNGHLALSRAPMILAYDADTFVKFGAPSSAGASTISTSDVTANNAHLTLDIDGDLIIDPHAGVTKWYLAGGTTDYVTFTQAVNGAFTIATLDADGAEADFHLDCDGDVKIEAFDGQCLFALGAASNRASIAFSRTDKDTHYMNWCPDDDSAITIGDGGIGFKNDAGNMYFKNSGGSWTSFGVSGRIKNVTQITGAIAPNASVTLSKGLDHGGSIASASLDVYVNGQMMRSGTAANDGDYKLPEQAHPNNLTFFFGLEIGDVVTAIKVF